MRLRIPPLFQAVSLRYSTARRALTKLDCDFVLEALLSETVNSCEASLSVYLIKRLRVNLRIAWANRTPLKQAFLVRSKREHSHQPDKFMRKHEKAKNIRRYCITYACPR